MRIRTLFPLIIATTLAAASPAPAADRPDVLFIAIDDLNDWTSALGGHPQARTPHLDRLMARGVTFTNAHCAAPACNPSRAALMSGLRPHQTGIYTNGDPAQGKMRDTLTLNRHFLAQGYRVLGGGKIYHNFNAEGREDSWTEWKGLFPSAGGHEQNLNGLDRSHFDWGPIPAKTDEMGDTQLTDWAIGELQKPAGDQPLFLAVGYVKPHLPWYVPQEYFDRFPLDSVALPTFRDDDLDDIPPAGVRMAGPDGDHAAVVEAGQWQRAVQGYLATISYLDDQIGRLLDGLDRSPRAGKTVIILWSDHGWHLGEKQHWRKFALWEEATRTVLTITAPGIAPAGQVCPAPVDYLSIYPTACELAGLPIPDSVKGPSLLPLLRDPAAQWDGVALCTHGRGNHAIRDARYRYIRYENGEEELYDHETDPMEYTNLAADPAQASVIARLAQHLPTEEASPTNTAPKAGGKGKGKGKAKAKGQPNKKAASQ
ncbi:MAG: sulfatase [Verrucomicrobiales bacterium]|nr:sulfatase [Verrucomicrobiales bacterium]